MAEVLLDLIAQNWTGPVGAVKRGLKPGEAPDAAWTRSMPIAETIDKNRLSHNFGRQAARYDQYAVVQRRLARELVHTLQASGERYTRILEIGCGTGYLTSLLRQAFPQAHLTALDLAPAAIQTAQTRLAGVSGIEWLVADGEQEPPARYDLITSSSVFQWFGQPARACHRYYRALLPGGMLAFATLGPRTFGELAASFARAGELLPEIPVPIIPAQNFANRRDWQEYLQLAGFRGIAWREEIWQEIYPDLWAFLRAVRGMGATSTRPVFLSRRLLALMADHYQHSFSRAGGIQVSYEVMWLHGNKPLVKESW